MSKSAILRWLASALLLFIGGLLAAGGLQLLRSGPAVWSDVVAPEPVVSRTAIGMLILGVLVLSTAATTAANTTWAKRLAVVVLVVFVVGAFWAHYLLFNELAPLRMVTNVVVSAFILLLLRWSDALRNKQIRAASDGIPAE